MKYIAYYLFITFIVLVMASCGGAGTQSAAVDSEVNAVGETQVTESSVSETSISDPTSASAGDASKAGSMIRGDRRKAVFFECFYALRPSWLNPPHEWGPYDGPKIDGWVVGNWNYLANDPGAYWDVVNRIGRGNASVDRWANMLDYSYAMRGGVERTGQCLFTTALILRRSVNYPLPVSWSQYPNTGPSARNAQPGDVVYFKNYPKSGMHHIGICVVKDNTGMDVVDANFVGYDGDGKHRQYRIVPGLPDSEIIGRHWVPNSKIDSMGWKVYSGKGR